MIGLVHGDNVENMTDAENAETELLHLLAICTSYSVFGVRPEIVSLELVIFVMLFQGILPVSLYLKS